MNQDGLESHKLKSIEFRKAWFDNNAWNKQNIFFSQLEAGHLLFYVSPDQFVKEKYFSNFG